MSHSQPSTIVSRYFELRSIRGRWVYIAALVPALLGAISFENGQYKFSLWGNGPWMVLIGVCLLQFFRPTLAGWLAVFSVYVCALGVILLWQVFGLFTSPETFGPVVVTVGVSLLVLALAVLFLQFPRRKNET